MIVGRIQIDLGLYYSDIEQVHDVNPIYEKVLLLSVIASLLTFINQLMPAEHIICVLLTLEKVFVEFVSDHSLKAIIALGQIDVIENGVVAIF